MQNSSSFSSLPFLSPLLTHTLISLCLGWGWISFLPFSLPISLTLGTLLYLGSFILSFYIARTIPFSHPVNHLREFLHPFIILPFFITLSLPLFPHSSTLFIVGIITFIALTHCHLLWLRRWKWGVSISERFYCLGLFLSISLLALLSLTFLSPHPLFLLIGSFLQLVTTPKTSLEKRATQPFSLYRFLWQRLSLKQRKKIALLLTKKTWLPSVLLSINLGLALLLMFFTSTLPIFNIISIGLYIMLAVTGSYSVRNRERATYALTLLSVGFFNMMTWYLPYDRLFSGIARFPDPALCFLIFGVLWQFLMLKSPLIYRKKTPYGLLEIGHNFNENALVLINNHIRHGAQYKDPARRSIPLLYFSPEGPAGQVLSFAGEIPTYKHIGVIGLGPASAIAYAKASQIYTFYEINPTVKEIAEQYFSFLSLSKAPYSIILGDALESLKKIPDRTYELLICDAYSGNKIPSHLLSESALECYMKKLSLQEGMLLLHVSSPEDAFLTELQSIIFKHGWVSLSQDYKPNSSLSVPKRHPLPFNLSLPKPPRPSTHRHRFFQNIVENSGLLTAFTTLDSESRWLLISHTARPLTLFLQDSRWERFGNILTQKTVLS